MRYSAALTGATHARLARHLLREDRQEDLCFLTWRPSTGYDRTTALIDRPLLPEPGERHVHGNVSFEAEYALRAAQGAAQDGLGVAFAHSHPPGLGWQRLNRVDQIAEARIANVASELTGLPLVGLTLAGDGSWAGRFWSGSGREVAPREMESVRVVGEGFLVTFNSTLMPPPVTTGAQERTVHTWGKATHANISRLRVAVAGVGSVGMPIAEILARTGIQHVGIFDFDTVEWVNLDRLRGAGPLDAMLLRPKAHVARRLLDTGSTAPEPQHEVHELSVCEPEGLTRLLDYDIIFSCVDRPWPRHVLNTIAYADLIPVVEGGLIAFQNRDQTLRNAYWRSTVVRPGRPCLACLGQYDRAHVQVERDGSLDDPSYIEGLPAVSPLRRRENVAMLSASVTSALLQQFVSYVARPSGFGDPGPLRFNIRDHRVEGDQTDCVEGCPFPACTGAGDARLDPAGRHISAERARARRARVGPVLRVCRFLDDILLLLRHRLGPLAPGWPIDD